MERAQAKGWKGLAAIVAMLVILLQAAVVPPARAEVIEVCTAHGIEKVLVKGETGPAMPGDCGHCGHCVLIAPADVPVSQLSIPVRYASAMAAVLERQETTVAPARPPPRPPGQGPPNT